jgi:DNA-binding winged helix-turn-helix (wHTH) protein
MVETAEERWFEFEEFRLDTRARVLWRGARVVPLPPKALDTLVSLLRHAGDVVLKRDLISEVWPDTSVDETGLAHNIWVLRKVLGASGRAIRTIPKRGYRFTGRVRALPDSAAPGHAAIVDSRNAAAGASRREPPPVVLAWCTTCERHVWTATLAEALEATGTSAELFAEYVNRGAVHYTDAAPTRVNLCMPSFIQALATTTHL